MVLNIKTSDNISVVKAGMNMSQIKLLNANFPLATLSRSRDPGSCTPHRLSHRNRKKSGPRAANIRIIPILITLTMTSVASARVKVPTIAS